jgi:hypothetical protein
LIWLPKTSCASQAGRGKAVGRQNIVVPKDRPAAVAAVNAFIDRARVGFLAQRDRARRSHRGCGRAGRRESRTIQNKRRTPNLAHAAIIAVDESQMTNKLTDAPFALPASLNSTTTHERVSSVLLK